MTWSAATGFDGTRTPARYAAVKRDLARAFPESRPGYTAGKAAVVVARGAERLPEIRHEFGDTKHRRVTYGLRAISRFRDFFDPAEPAELFRTDGTSSEVLVPSSARPPIPLLRSVVPAFTWEKSRAGAVLTRRRLGGRLRVELAPPWFTTGAGERLAVITAAGEPDPSLWPYLTQVGRDPIWDTPIPPRSPQIGGDPVLLSVNGAEVRSLGHPVWSFGDSRYADVAIPADGS